MNKKDQEIIKNIRLGILKEIAEELKSLSSSEKKKINEKELYLGEPPSYIIDTQIEILKELKKEDLIKDFKIKEKKYDFNLKPPEKPSGLEMEIDIEKAQKKYESELFTYKHEKNLSNEIYLIATIKYIPRIIEKYIKDNNINISGQKTKSLIKNKDKNIEIITVVKSKNGTSSFEILINNDYLNLLTANRIKPSWNLLFKIAQGEQVLLEGNKSNFDYFNSNKNNKIYTQTGYKKTKIFKLINNIIIPNIKVELISEKTFKTRLNKSLTKT